MIEVGVDYLYNLHRGLYTPVSRSPPAATATNDTFISSNDETRRKVRSLQILEQCDRFLMARKHPYTNRGRFYEPTLLMLVRVAHLLRVFIRTVSSGRHP